ncbi:Putative deoxyribonuclease I [Bathymodiolus thermophilus thioautotrophic gill symbiont]|uniref:Deoxyribonuclease I n=1 Tax=Bathymodiolus thermophilus thioautotrophic gill symbiont TaxID=2360 RepID=A0A3G3IMQ1_9GAMM|nr:endonuclease [Bathymodiolus thermophilus thioautotrophic gill symbiont]AYQ57075.1 Putative deoxyribonuclease I [Bathymodiolus thermophilus thioautotrophic gill symbiont]
MKNFIISYALTLNILVVANTSFANSPSSFNNAKKLMYRKIYYDNQKTFYCGCDYSNRKVDLNSCGYQVRKNKSRASRTEAEHIVPAYWLAQLTPLGRSCWLEGTKRKGTNGRKYCLKTNKTFKQAYNDLMNLVPSIGEVNGDRSNYQFGLVSGEIRNYGACDIEINISGARNLRKVEPAPSVRGDIARIYFYMFKKYGLNLSMQTKKLMNAWHQLDPIDDWESVRLKRIEIIQGK